MINLALSGASRPLKVLCLGCHSDDIEIGCGGTILRLAQDYPGSLFHCVVFSAIGAREAEARRAAELFAGSNIGGPMLKQLRDGFMPSSGAETDDMSDSLNPISPDVVLTHSL